MSVSKDYYLSVIGDRTGFICESFSTFLRREKCASSDFHDINLLKLKVAVNRLLFSLAIQCIK